MAKSRLIGSYPVIGIRPTIDGRRGPLKVRESLEVQTMNMAKNAAKLIQENVFYSNGEPVKVVIADTTIGRVAEAAACADKFKKEGEMLGKGLSIVIDILNPEKIVLGGVFMRSSELLIPSMRKVLERETLSGSLSVCEIVPAQLSENIGDVAALSLAKI